MPDALIEDPADPRLDDYRRLTDTPHRRAYEQQHGVFVAEGPKVVRQLLTSSYHVRSVVVTPRRAPELADVLASAAAPVHHVPSEVLDAVVGFRLSRGAIAAGVRSAPPAAGTLLAGARRVVVLEECNDHDNLGSVFRSARAFGADAVLLGPRCVDPLYRRTVRVSMGHVLHVPHAFVDALPQGLGVVHDAGIETVALTPDPAVATIAAIPRDRPLALLLGAEGPGLGSDTCAAAHHRARIPIASDVDSLNVAVAAAVALHALA